MQILKNDNQFRPMELVGVKCPDLDQLDFPNAFLCEKINLFRESNITSFENRLQHQ